MGLVSDFTKFKASLLGIEIQTINTGLKLLNKISTPPAVHSPKLVVLLFERLYPGWGEVLNPFLPIEHQGPRDIWKLEEDLCWDRKQ